MKTSTTDRIRGKFHELKGKAKEKAGEVIGDRHLESEGKSENLAGKIQKKVGQVKDILGS